MQILIWFAYCHLDLSSILYRFRFLPLELMVKLCFINVQSELPMIYVLLCKLCLKSYIFLLLFLLFGLTFMAIRLLHFVILGWLYLHLIHIHLHSPIFIIYRLIIILFITKHPHILLFPPPPQSYQPLLVAPAPIVNIHQSLLHLFLMLDLPNSLQKLHRHILSIEVPLES